MSTDFVKCAGCGEMLPVDEAVINQKGKYFCECCCEVCSTCGELIPPGNEISEDKMCSLCVKRSNSKLTVKSVMEKLKSCDENANVKIFAEAGGVETWAGGQITEIEIKNGEIHLLCHIPGFDYSSRMWTE